jgi:hypothetical protein
VIQKLDGWWEGSLGSKRGLFPDNFVKVISSPPETQSAKEDEVFKVELRKKPCNRKLKALFSYSPEQDDELTLQVGDIVDFISEVEDGWWKGSLNGRTGIFPSNFVEDATAPTTNGTPGEANKLEPKPNDKNRATFIVRGTQDSPSADIVNTDDEPAPKLPPKPVPRPSYNPAASFTFLESYQESNNINDAFLVVTNTNTIYEEISEPHCLAYGNMSMQRAEMSADSIECIRNSSGESFGDGNSKNSLCSLLQSMHVDDRDVSFSEFVEGIPPLLTSPVVSKKKCVSVLDMSYVVEDGNHSRLHLHSTPADTAKSIHSLKHSDEYCELRRKSVIDCGKLRIRSEPLTSSDGDSPS